MMARMWFSSAPSPIIRVHPRAKTHITERQRTIALAAGQETEVSKARAAPKITVKAQCALFARTSLQVLVLSRLLHISRAHQLFKRISESSRGAHSRRPQIRPQKRVACLS